MWCVVFSKVAIIHAPLSVCWFLRIFEMETDPKRARWWNFSKSDVWSYYAVNSVVSWFSRIFSVATFHSNVEILKSQLATELTIENHCGAEFWESLPVATSDCQAWQCTLQMYIADAHCKCILQMYIASVYGKCTLQMYMANVYCKCVETDIMDLM